jgi:CheY-like chemotaxis protein
MLKRLLVVDDDATLRDLLRVHLQAAGYSVTVAPDAAEAIRAVLAEKPDLIISDINMPYMDGLELLEVLRADPATADIPLMVFTASDSDEHHARARRLGVAGYLVKPIMVDELLRVIESGVRGVRTAA